MSITAHLDVECRDPDAIKKACEVLDLKCEAGTFDLYQTKGEVGTAVYLQGWKYPAIIKEDGNIAYDNYNERWGKEEELNMFVQRYGLEAAKTAAMLKGYTCTESEPDNVGNIKLTIQVEG